ncbi:MAG: hypothetical protein WCS65_07660 [Verrucomicrobiae bacterium]
MASVALLLGGLAALRGQMESLVGDPISVPLTVNVFEEHSPCESLRYTSDPSWGFAQVLREKPTSEIKSVPNLESPTYFRIPLGNREFLAILDVGKNAEKAALYIDFDGQGQFEAIKGIEGVDQYGSSSPSANFKFGPVTLPKNEESAASPVEVMVSCYVNKKDATRVPYLRITPQTFVSGKLPMGSEEYDVAFVDGAFSGKFQAFNPDPSITRSARARDQRFGATRMGIDLDKNGKLEYRKEIFPMVDLVRINEKYYRVSIAPDGSEAKFQEAKPELGVFDSKCPGMEMFVTSDKCAALLAGNADGKWELPPGKYTTQGFVLSLSVGDEKWALEGSQPNQARYFEIKAGTPTVLALGPPLTLSYSVDKTSAGAASIGLKVAGISGETYSAGATKGWSRQPAPQFTITSEAGENLAQGSFEYG